MPAGPNARALWKILDDNFQYPNEKEKTTYLLDIWDKLTNEHRIFGRRETVMYDHWEVYQHSVPRVDWLKENLRTLASALQLPHGPTWNMKPEALDWVKIFVQGGSWEPWVRPWVQHEIAALDSMYAKLECSLSGTIIRSLRYPRRDGNAQIGEFEAWSSRLYEVI